MAPYLEKRSLAILESSSSDCPSGDPPSDFRALTAKLYALLAICIQSGSLTLKQLAEQTGLSTPYLWLVLHGQKRLSCDGLDRVLDVLDLSILDLIDRQELYKRSTIVHRPSAVDHDIPVINDSNLLLMPWIALMHIQDTVKVKAAFLLSLEARPERGHSKWERFVAIRTDVRDTSMDPYLARGASVVVDRHYNSLQPYRPDRPSMYVIARGPRPYVRFVELSASFLVLRPASLACPVEIVPLGVDCVGLSCIAGRVCFVGTAT